MIEQPKYQVKNDQPIRHEREDALDRTTLARIIAREIETIDDSTGSVVAITGPWGSGKTSLVNLIIDQLDSRISHFQFNPWFFSGSSDLLERFFDEFSSELGTSKGKQKKLAQALERYGNALSAGRVLPVVGGTVEVGSLALKGSGALLKGDQVSPVQRKQKLEKALKEFDRRFIVFIDDLDRLEPKEIREIMKLVRLIGNLPRVIYLLAYDVERVERALDFEGQSGKEYLEKIVFSTYQIPSIHESHIRKLIGSGLNNLFEKEAIVPTSQELRRIGLINEVLLRSIATVRNAKRFLVSIRPAVLDLNGDIDMDDLLCLETLRLFHAEVFRLIQIHANVLSWAPEDYGLFNKPRNEAAKSAVEEVLAADGNASVKWAIKNLFPLAWQQYEENSTGSEDVMELLRDVRVGNRHVFTRYLERYDDRGLIARRRTEALLRSDPTGIADQLSHLQLDEVADIADLCSVLSEQPSEDLVVNLSAALLNLSTLESTVKRRWYDPGITPPTRRLIARSLIPMNYEARKSNLQSIYGKVVSLEAKYKAVTVSEMEDLDSRPLFDQQSRANFTRRFCDDLKATSAEELEQERWLLFLSHFVMTEGNIPSHEMPNFFETPELAWALLKSATRTELSDRHGGEHWIFDVHAVDNVLGSRDRTRELLTYCETHLDDEVNDGPILQAAQQSVLNGAPIVGSGES